MPAFLVLYPKNINQHNAHNRPNVISRLISHFSKGNIFVVRRASFCAGFRVTTTISPCNREKRFTCRVGIRVGVWSHADFASVVACIFAHAFLYFAVYMANNIYPAF